MLQIQLIPHLSPPIPLRNYVGHIVNVVVLKMLVIRMNQPYLLEIVYRVENLNLKLKKKRVMFLLLIKNSARLGENIGNSFRASLYKV